MSRLIVMLVTLSWTLGVLQYGWPQTEHDPNRIDPLRGNAVRYRFPLGADIVVKIAGTNRYVRLRYSPFDFGWDAPAAKPSQLMPDEMFRDGNLVWKFQVHEPRNSEESGACSVPPTQGASDREGHKYSPIPYKSVPGRENDEPPAIESLPCLIVKSWTNTKTGASGPDRPGKII